MPLLDKLRKALEEKPQAIWIPQPIILCQHVIPRPLHGLAPRTILGPKWWNATRQAAYLSTNFHCIACGVHKYNAQGRQWLEGHECYDVDYAAGLAVYQETVPLCHYCHNYIHSGRLQALLDRGKIPHAKYAAIIQHGDNVLKQAKLPKQKQYKGHIAKWRKWRLVLNGKKYPPKFKTLSEWEQVYGK